MRPRGKFFKILYVVPFLLLLIVINNRNIRETVRGWTLDLTQSFFSGVSIAAHLFSDGLQKIGESVDIYKERDSQQIEITRLKSELIHFEETKIENRRLRALLDFQNKNELKGKSALIVGRDISSINDIIVINRGENDDVGVGTVLISHQGVVGHVVSAGKIHSKALLITDLKARVCAIIQETRDAGIIEGTTAHLLKLKHLSLNASLKIGDTVLTSGFGDIFPKGLPIGVVRMLGTEPDNLHLYALIEPFVDFSKLEEVLCLNNE